MKQWLLYYVTIVKKQVDNYLNFFKKLYRKEIVFVFFNIKQLVYFKNLYINDFFKKLCIIYQYLYNFFFLY